MIISIPLWTYLLFIITTFLIFANNQQNSRVESSLASGTAGTGNLYSTIPHNKTTANRVWAILCWKCIVWMVQPLLNDPHNNATANGVWALYNLIKFSWIEIELLNDPPEQNCGGLSHPPAHKRELKERARSKPDDINAWSLLYNGVEKIHISIWMFYIPCLKLTAGWFET